MNLVFLGGSITWGACADTYEDTWAYKIEEYLRNRFYEPVKSTNLGISGTGTRLGVFRMSQQVMPCKPDFLVFEFSVNDSGLAAENPDAVIVDSEYIFRTLIKANPGVRILVLSSAMRNLKACVDLHKKVADHYGAGHIDLQSYFHSLVESGEYTWDDLLADHVHPTTKGHAVYAAYVIQWLEEHPEFFGKDLTLAEPLLPSKYYCPTIVDPHGFDWSEGWADEPYEDIKRDPSANVDSAWTTRTLGAEGRVTFRGSTFSVYHYVGQEGGLLEVTVDDRPPIFQETYYNCSGDFVHFCMVNDLEYGEHTVRLRNVERNPGEGAGRISIAGFLMN